MRASGPRPRGGGGPPFPGGLGAGWGRRCGRRMGACCDAGVGPAPLVGARASFARRLGRDLLAGRGGERVVVVVAAGGGEELDVADDLVVVAAGAFVGFPFAVLQASVDGDEPALGEDACGGLTGVAERVDVDVAD